MVMDVYRELADIIREHGNKLSMHMHDFYCTEPHAIYNMYYNGLEFRYSFGSHGEYGISIEPMFREPLKGVLTSSNQWVKSGDDEPSDIPSSLVGLVTEIKHSFENKDK